MTLLYKYILWFCLLSLFLPYGCVPKKTPPIATKQPTQHKPPLTPTKEQAKKMKSIKQTYYIHIVRWDGETMSLIARWYIGQYESWKLLARHNPEINPNNIHIGDRVWIPKKDMKTSEQMPKTFVNKYSKNKKNKQIKKPKTKPALELYGPKEHEEKIEEYGYDQ